jgi:hypothetical protein
MERTILTKEGPAPRAELAAALRDRISRGRESLCGTLDRIRTLPRGGSAGRSGMDNEEAAGFVSSLIFGPILFVGIAGTGGMLVGVEAQNLVASAVPTLPPLAQAAFWAADVAVSSAALFFISGNLLKNL